MQYGWWIFKGHKDNNEKEPLNSEEIEDPW